MEKQSTPNRQNITTNTGAQDPTSSTSSAAPLPTPKVTIRGGSKTGSSKRSIEPGLDHITVIPKRSRLAHPFTPAQSSPLNVKPLVDTLAGANYGNSLQSHGVEQIAGVNPNLIPEETDIPTEPDNTRVIVNEVVYQIGDTVIYKPSLKSGSSSPKSQYAIVRGFVKADEFLNSEDEGGQFVVLTKMKTRVTRSDASTSTTRDTEFCEPVSCLLKNLTSSPTKLSLSPSPAPSPSSSTIQKPAPLLLTSGMLSLHRDPLMATPATTATINPTKSLLPQSPAPLPPTPQQQTLTDPQTSNELTKLSALALETQHRLPHFIDTISKMLTSHTPLFMSLFGPAFLKWLSWMQETNKTRFMNYVTKICGEEYSVLQKLFSANDGSESDGGEKSAYKEDEEELAFLSTLIPDFFVKESLVVQPKASHSRKSSSSSTTLPPKPQPQPESKEQQLLTALFTKHFIDLPNTNLSKRVQEVLDIATTKCTPLHPENFAFASVASVRESTPSVERYPFHIVQIWKEDVFSKPVVQVQYLRARSTTSPESVSSSSSGSSESPISSLSSSLSPTSPTTPIIQTPSRRTFIPSTLWSRIFSPSFPFPSSPSSKQYLCYIKFEYLTIRIIARWMKDYIGTVLKTVCEKEVEDEKSLLVEWEGKNAGIDVGMGEIESGSGSGSKSKRPRGRPRKLSGRDDEFMNEPLSETKLYERLREEARRKIRAYRFVEFKLKEEMWKREVEALQRAATFRVFPTSTVASVSSSMATTPALPPFIATTPHMTSNSVSTVTDPLLLYSGNIGLGQTMIMSPVPQHYLSNHHRMPSASSTTLLSGQHMDFLRHDTSSASLFNDVSFSAMGMGEMNSLGITWETAEPAPSLLADPLSPSSLFFSNAGNKNSSGGEFVDPSFLEL